MISYVKALFALVVVAFAAVVFVGCTGLSSQDAIVRCKEEQKARGDSCFNTTSFDSCVTASEDCGDSAKADDKSCPLTFSCPL